MSAARSSERGSDDAILAGRLQLALLGRLVLATIVLGGTLLFANLAAHGFTSQAVYGLIVAAYAASAANAVAITRTQTRLARLAAMQIGTDLVLTSGLVYLTGGAQSGFAFLFGASVLATALVGSGRSATFVAGVTLVLYGSIALGLANGGLPGPPDQPPESYAPAGADLATALLRNLVGLVVVGGLAATLGDRLQQTRTELARVARSAAGYAQLNEDVVRSLASGLLTLDAADRVMSANPAAATILGADDVDALIEQPITRYFDVSSSKTDRREGLGRRQDATTFPVGYTRAPLRSADGTEQGSLLIFQDLTELMGLRRKAERADRLAVLGSLAAGLAHEIRNPLGSISGSVELVRDGAALDEEDRTLLDSVLKETDRLNELVTTMLEVGRAGPAERVQVPLGPIAREVIELARRGASDVSVELEVVPDERVTGVVDPQQIRQVLWNLVRNAIQFSPPKGSVRVRVSRDEQALVLEVSDEGPGVAEADRERLFDMFFTRRRRGLGLGLALTKQIVDAHQGEIVALPNEPRGSIFRVRIPHEVTLRTSDPRIFDPPSGDAPLT
ncbi:MAG: PAS domain-containing protein [Deltaproteobacteria bacterium]|nr:PAS domain-containing protein [Deltaproteobacteria bacterium]